MDPRLLDYYNRELSFIREMGQEFAQSHPKIAGRLGMKGTEIADPFVERLIESFALLTGRIQLKMDAEFPKFSQRLLELVYPHYLAPTPAMGIVRMHPGDTDKGLTGSFTLPRHSAVRTPVSPGQITPCQFSTAHNVELLPLCIAHAQMAGQISDVRIPTGSQKVHSSLSIGFAALGEHSIQSMDFDQLPIYIAGPLERALLLLELVCGRRVAAAIRWKEGHADQQVWLGSDQVEGIGFEEHEGLIPYGNKSFGGYRLLQEYFACPDRFRFFKVSGLRPILQRIAGRQFELVVYFDRPVVNLEKVVSADSFLLFCTPVINLFPKRGDRVDISMAHYEHHLLGDRTRPLDYEVYSVSSIQGFNSSNAELQKFLPLYETLGAAGASQAYFSMRREPRKLSEVARRNGPRTGYIGSEVFVQLVDRLDVPYSGDISRIAPEMWCTNRDLSLLVTSAGERNLELMASAPVSQVELISHLTRPSPAIAEMRTAWLLISHLQLNYQTLTDSSPQEGAKVMRELLSLYALLSEHETAQQTEAVVGMQVTPMHARVPRAGPILFCRGVDVQLTLDQAKFGIGSPWLFAAVMERFIARHVGINTATRLKVSTLQKGEFARWPARMGMRPNV